MKQLQINPRWEGNIINNSYLAFSTFLFFFDNVIAIRCMIN